MLVKMFHGFCMALADSVPGVSGGTVAFILGFYEKFIDALHGLFGKDNGARKVAVLYLAKLGVGWCLGLCLSVVALNDLFQERKKDDITDPAAFRKHFAAHTADGREADDQVTPQLRDLVQKLEASSRTSKLCGLILRDGDLTLALNTRYVFAGVPEWLDLRDIDGIRKWFTASLTGMGNLLDLITESPALTGTTE